LVEIAGVVEATKDCAFKDDACHGGGDECDGQCRKERPADKVHQGDRDIAAEHGEAAMRQVDEIHHPERHRQPDRQQKQQHSVSDAVEQHAEDRRHRALP
jgi:hypothetical protein